MHAKYPTCVQEIALVRVMGTATSPQKHVSVGELGRGAIVQNQNVVVMVSWPQTEAAVVTLGGMRQFQEEFVIVLDPCVPLKSIA